MIDDMIQMKILDIYKALKYNILKSQTFFILIF